MVTVWMYIERAETAAGSRGTSHVTTKHWYTTSMNTQNVVLKMKKNEKMKNKKGGRSLILKITYNKSAMSLLESVGTALYKRSSSIKTII